MDTISALGVKINNISLIEAKHRIAGFLYSARFHQVATVNPDFVMVARKNEKFLSVINNADLSLADGVGIHIPAFLENKTLKERVPGADLIDYVLAYAQEFNFSVFLLARADGLSSYAETKSAMLRRFPWLKISGCDVDIYSHESLEETLKKVRGAIVFANFGAPLQDIFLSQLRSLPKSEARLVMGIGGTFDFLTGKKRRAPLLVRNIGLEWLWRLILQPRRRLKRTFNYVVIFSLLCVWEALQKYMHLPSLGRAPLNENVKL